MYVVTIQIKDNELKLLDSIVIGVAEDKNDCIRLIRKYRKTRVINHPKNEHFVYTAIVADNGRVCAPVYWFSFE